MSFSLKVIDHGMDDLFERLKDVQESYVKVGVLDEDEKGGEVRESGLTNAEIAAVLEFGTQNKHIPARPVIRPTFDEKREELVTLGKKLIGDVIDGRLKIERALGMMGSTLVTAMRLKITSGVAPPNAPSTLERKALKSGKVKRAMQRVGNAVIQSWRPIAFKRVKREGKFVVKHLDAGQMQAEMWRRIGKHAAAAQNLDKVLAASMAAVKPWIDTSTVLRAFTYAVYVRGKPR